MPSVDHRPDSGANLKAVNQTASYLPLGGSGQWWGVRCTFCRTWITKFDHSREEALALAAGHECGGDA